MSLQTNTNLKKSLKNILNCCKLQIVSKNEIRLSNNFHFKDRFAKYLFLVSFISWMCSTLECKNWWTSWYITICTSPLIKKQVKPKYNFKADHLLFCNYLASYDNFSILTFENKKFIVEQKESLLIMRDKPSLNRNITEAPLYLFDRP